MRFAVDVGEDGVWRDRTSLQAQAEVTWGCSSCPRLPPTVRSCTRVAKLGVWDFAFCGGLALSAPRVGSRTVAAAAVAVAVEVGKDLQD